MSDVCFAPKSRPSRVRLGQIVICSINVGSSTGAFELLTRFDTGQRCKNRLDRLEQLYTADIEPGSKVLGPKMTGIRSCTSATNTFGPVMIIVQDFNVSPLALSLHSSHSPANVSASEPSRAVKYQGCLPLSGVLPLVITRRRDQAAAAFESVAKERLGLDCFRPRIEGRSSGFLKWLCSTTDGIKPQRMRTKSRFPSCSVTTSTGSVGQILYRGCRLCGGALSASR